MAYDTMETSVDDGRPIELYEVSFTGNFWYMTSADRDIVFEGRTYQALAIERQDIEPTLDVNQASLTVSFPRDVEFTEIFRISPPSEIVSFKLLTQNYLVPGDYVILWRGRIINGEVQDPWWVATVENVFSSLRRPGLRRRYSITCPLALYGEKCGVSRETWREITPVVSFNGLSVFALAATGKPDNYYAGGYLTYANAVSGNLEKRMIRSSVGATGELVLATLPVGMAGGILLNLYRGCNHTIGAGGCLDFDNVRRYGGQPYIPQKNPYDGSILYS